MRFSCLLLLLTLLWLAQHYGKHLCRSKLAPTNKADEAEAEQMSTVDFGTSADSDFGCSTEGEARMAEDRAEGEAELDKAKAEAEARLNKAMDEAQI